jgi:hypothetical protein
MKLRFKYWSNDNGGFQAKEVFCETVKQIKEMVARFKEERTDIDNLEVYLGTECVVRLYDYQRKQ